MKLATNLEYFLKNMDITKAARVLEEAGFAHVDYTPELKRFQWKSFEKDLEILQDHGISVYQCHAPFNRYQTYASVEEHMRLVDLSLDVAERAGAKYLVVHGDEYDFGKPYTKERALAYNYELFAPIVEKAVAKGVGIAFENVFQDTVPFPRYGSEAEDLAALIDTFACPEVCCCWDFGHGAVAYPKGQEQAMAVLGKRIRCTHVHDNYLESDMHLIPMLGKIDWNTCMKVFLDTADAKVFSFELVYGNVVEETAATFAKFLYATGRKLICG